MVLDLLREKGTPIERQRFAWSELAGIPISKLDCDAFTRVRIVLMNGIEAEALRFSHACARMNQHLQQPLALVRRAEHHQQTMVNWLLPADLSPLETTIAFEQVAIEVTAAVAEHEPDEYLAQTFRFGLLEDFDHMYRFAALMDRVMGADANSILQCYTDILPGRPTVVEHRAPIDDVRRPYERTQADPLSKLHALTICAAEHQTHDYYMTIGPMFADPVARQLYAEIASIEEQHVTQYESIIDPNESWAEKWVLHEASEVYNYYSCMKSESDRRVKQIWERMLDYELGHLQVARRHFEDAEGRDSAEILPRSLPDPIEYRSHRQFVRDTLEEEADLRARGSEFVGIDDESAETLAYRKQLNRAGSPSQAVATGYCWRPGTELSADDLVTVGGNGNTARRARANRRKS
jgi:hypothetical protein